MYLTRGGSVQRQQISGPRGWPAIQVLSRFGPWLLGHVSTREEEGRAVEKGGARCSTWPAGHVARPAGHYLVSYRLSHVGGALPWPYKYPSTGGNQNTHHNLEITLAKIPFLV
jgi:hypothetical protein